MLDSSKLERDLGIARRVPRGAGGDRRDLAGAPPSRGVPVSELADWAVDIQRRHFEGVRASSLELAKEEARA